MDNECMFYAGYKNKKGYAKKYVKIDGQLEQAYLHREIYIKYKGYIEEGFVIDHLCRNTCCINIEHLEAVTNRENLRRGIGPKPYGEYCNKGHYLKEVGVVRRNKGSAFCRKCKNEAARIWRNNNMDKVIANRERFKAKKLLLSRSG